MQISQLVSQTTINGFKIDENNGTAEKKIGNNKYKVTISFTPGQVPKALLNSITDDELNQMEAVASEFNWKKKKGSDHKLTSITFHNENNLFKVKKNYKGNKQTKEVTSSYYQQKIAGIQNPPVQNQNPPVQNQNPQNPPIQNLQDQIRRQKFELRKGKLERLEGTLSKKFITKPVNQNHDI